MIEPDAADRSALHYLTLATPIGYTEHVPTPWLRRRNFWRYLLGWPLLPDTRIVFRPAPTFAPTDTWTITQTITAD